MIKAIVFTGDSFADVFYKYENFIYNNTIEIVRIKVNNATNIQEIILIYKEL
jgi:hypothetical protein